MLWSTKRYRVRVETAIFCRVGKVCRKCRGGLDCLFGPGQPFQLCWREWLRLAFPVPFALFNELKQRATKPPILRSFDQVGPADLFGGNDGLGVLSLFFLLETDGFLFLLFPPAAF